jgi:hypothetical protein
MLEQKVKTDIRLDVDFLNHLKVKKLIRELGDSGVLYLLRIWGYAGKHRSKGVLHGMNEEDIADVAQWNGNPIDFVELLIKHRWLGRIGENYVIHEWDIHQPYAFHSEERSESARKSVNRRWKQKNQGMDTDTNRIPTVFGPYTPSPLPTPNPIPIPDPNPIPDPIPDPSPNPYPSNNPFKLRPGPYVGPAAISSVHLPITPIEISRVVSEEIGRISNPDHRYTAEALVGDFLNRGKDLQDTRRELRRCGMTGKSVDKIIGLMPSVTPAIRR